MKICFASDYLIGYHKQGAGAEQACYRVAKLLIRNGDDVVFLCTKPDSMPQEQLKVYGVKTMGQVFFGKLIKKALRRFFPFDIAAGINSLKLLKDIKPDVLHLQNFNELSFSLVWAAKRLNIPVIFSVYDFSCVCPAGTLVNSGGESCGDFQGKYCSDCFSRRNKIINFLRIFGILKLGFILRKRITDYFFRKIDYFIALSETWKDLLIKYGVKKSKIVVIPLPLSQKTNFSGIPAIGNSILFVGWIYPHKGLHILIEALPQILKEVPDATLKVVESGVDENYKNKIIKRAEEIGVKEKINFLGKLPNDKVQKLIQNAKVVAVPEQWGIAWPIFLTEAMVQARAIVASRIGNIPDFIADGENGFLAEPRNPADFAEKIILLLREEKAKEFGRKAREKIIQICDEDKISEKLKNLYKFL